jgi:uncharacterized protein YjbI with pentapeptide repeats
MANEEQLAILRQGVEVWNKWKKENDTAIIDLSSADLSRAMLMGVDLYKADLRKADLKQANLRQAKLFGSNLGGADLTGANLRDADLNRANLNEACFEGANLLNAHLSTTFCFKSCFSRACLQKAKFIRSDLDSADLTGAILMGADLDHASLRDTNLEKADLKYADLSDVDLTGAILIGADLTEANLTGADLTGANLSEADLTGANLISSNFVQAKISHTKISKSRIYGVNVWDLVGEFKEQQELILTPDNESIITVDNIKVAQFVYLLLNNKEIRDVINTLTSKTVLILGRFSIPERKAILDALRNKLREYDLLPIVFDFDRPTDKDFTETIKTLAGISYFVIADVTNPKSSPLELQATVPDYQIPFVPIIQEGESPFAMMVDLQKKYDWVLDTVSYDSLDTLVEILKPLIIDPAIKMRDKLRIIKAAEPTIISGREWKEKK